MLHRIVNKVYNGHGLCRIFNDPYNPLDLPNNTFANCVSNTQTGAAELAQIPSSWGGTGD